MNIRFRRILLQTSGLALLITSTAWSTLTPPETNGHNPKGKIFELNSNRSKILFNFEWSQNLQDKGDVKEMAFKSVYRDPSGKEALIEEAQTVNGQFQRYKLTQFQVNEQSIVERNGDKVVFWHGPLTSPKEKLGRSEEKWDDRFAVGPMLVTQLQKNWKKILSGQDVDLRFGVVDRKETIGFTFFKIAETSDRVTIKMKPTSFIISAFVDPIFFQFSKDGQKILEMKGRILPKINKNGRWKDLDAEVVYHTED